MGPAPSEPNTGRRYSFGEFTLDLERGVLLRSGADVDLRPKAFQVLRVLVERHGRLVSKQELLDAVWGRVVVTEGSIAKCLIDIRRAIDDAAQTSIKTVPRRGYIFDAPVTVGDGDTRLEVRTETRAPAYRFDRTRVDARGGARRSRDPRGHLRRRYDAWSAAERLRIAASARSL